MRAAQYLRKLDMSLSVQVLFGALLSSGILVLQSADLVLGAIAANAKAAIAFSKSLHSEFSSYHCFRPSGVRVDTIIDAHVRTCRFYDPVLMRIFRTGFLLPVGGILFGIAGVWKSSSVCWHTQSAD
jgi:hypothetical protein